MLVLSRDRQREKAEFTSRKTYTEDLICLKKDTDCRLRLTGDGHTEKGRIV